MSDPAHKETDRLLKEMEKKIAKEYRQAEQKISEKMVDYLRRFVKKDKTWQKWVMTGYKNEKQYMEWKIGQMAMGKRWADLRNTLAQDLRNANKISRSIVNGYMPDVYAINHNYATYEIEHGLKIDTSYTLYDHQTVERLLRDDPDLLPTPGKNVSKDIIEGKALRWDKKQIQSVMIQSILQGESIPDIATRLAETVGESERKAAVRNARTMTTGAENAGRVDGYKRAQSMGINVRKQWVATLDGRTRHEHRLLDGQVTEPGEPFNVEGELIRFPGDPWAAAHLIYNCRCTLIASLKGHEINLSDPNIRRRKDEDLGGMSYSEWKKSKATYSNPILLPEEKAAAIKGAYINEYRNGYEKKNYARVKDQMRAEDGAKYTPEEILRELQLSQIGIDTIRRLRDKNAQITIKEKAPRPDIRGMQQGSKIELYSETIPNNLVAAQTLIHETTHLWYNIGGCQHAEAICFAMEKMHKERRNYLTENEWAKMVKLAIDNYPNLQWEKGGYGNYKQFNFVKKDS